MKKGFRFETTLMVVAIITIVCSISFVVLDSLLLQSPAVTTQFPNRVQEVLPSVVHITNHTCGWQGSGVVIVPNIIVTARHMIQWGTDFTITLEDGRELKASKAISSKKYDIGFLKLDSDIMLKPAKFGLVTGCILGQPLFAVGSTAGKINFNSISLGIVSGLNRGGDWKNRAGEDFGWSVVFQTDAEGMGGNSGCPVFTMDGVVRGIWVGSIPPAVHYCIPVDVFLNDIGMIQLMFGTDNYKIEKIRPFNDGMEW